LKCSTVDSGRAPSRSDSLWSGARRLARSHQVVDHRLHGRDLWPGLGKQDDDAARVGRGEVAGLLHEGIANVDANALHRVVAIASGGLDSLPHNGYVVTTIRGVCRETHKSACWPMFCMTVLVPMFGLVVALLLL